MFNCSKCGLRQSVGLLVENVKQMRVKVPISRRNDKVPAHTYNTNVENLVCRMNAYFGLEKSRPVICNEVFHKKILLWNTSAKIRIS